VAQRVVDAVRSRRAFSALSSSRARGRSGPLWVVRAEVPAEVPESHGDPVRVAYALGRAVGSAVVRNRVRRRLRAIVRDLDAAGTLAPGLYLIGATPAVTGASAAELRGHLVAALPGRR
jgi:ribonuclease P protein component